MNQSPETAAPEFLQIKGMDEVKHHLFDFNIQNIGLVIP
jgi:hypothetical protein